MAARGPRRSSTIVTRTADVRSLESTQSYATWHRSSPLWGNRQQLL